MEGNLLAMLNMDSTSVPAEAATRPSLERLPEVEWPLSEAAEDILKNICKFEKDVLNFTSSINSLPRVFGALPADNVHVDVISLVVIVAVLVVHPGRDVVGWGLMMI